jgi:LPXTG-motif cell wall-anchored protein
MRVLLVAFLGGITGAIATDVFGPELVNWWATPPVRTTCDCAANMAYAMSHLVWAQVILTVSGAALFTGLYLIFFRRKRAEETSA